MARPYAGAAGTHMFFGLLCIAAGIAWICLLFFYKPLYDDGKSFLEDKPQWLHVLLSAKIYCGFWFFVTGAVGCCIKKRGCTEGVFVAFNVLNVIIWVPVLLLIMVVSAWLVAFDFTLPEGLDVEFEPLKQKFSDNLWLWAFPGIGAAVGVIEFILSIVSYSIVCCCRPSALNEGYEYQYEMK